MHFEFYHFLLKRVDGGWGSLKNGSWNGLVRTVLKGEADLIGGSLTLRSDRAEVLNYLIPIGRSFNGVFIKVREISPFVSFLVSLLGYFFSQKTASLST